MPIVWLKYPTEFICPICLFKPKNSGFQWKKASLGVRIPCFLPKRYFNVIRIFWEFSVEKQCAHGSGILSKITIGIPVEKKNISFSRYIKARSKLSIIQILRRKNWNEGFFYFSEKHNSATNATINHATSPWFFTFFTVSYFKWNFFTKMKKHPYWIIKRSIDSLNDCFDKIS